MTAVSDTTPAPWWVSPEPPQDAPPKFRAVAYYRHSAQDRQENSVAIQQEQVRQWARANGVEIIEEFADRGKSGGYWAGGKPPFGFQRLLLSETRQPVQVLAPGQRKSIQNQRVTLTEGDEAQVQAVKRIFREFTQTLSTTNQIADGLNRDGVESPGGGPWTSASVRRILHNEQYMGTLVYNRTTQKLKTPTRKNPKSDWVKTDSAFTAIIDRSVFERAQSVLAQALQRYAPEFMLAQLGRLIDEHGFLRPSLVARDEAAPSPATYAKHFCSLDAAHQHVFRLPLDDVRNQVESRLRDAIAHVEAYDDFLVLNRRITVLIQPSVPVAYGYNQYWYFRPDRRGVVDITLGVPVSGPRGPEILGYLALPRLLVRSRGIRVFGSSEARLDLHGYTGLEVIVQLARSP